MQQKRRRIHSSPPRRALFRRYENRGETLPKSAPDGIVWSIHVSRGGEKNWTTGGPTTSSHTLVSYQASGMASCNASRWVGGTIRMGPTGEAREPTLNAGELYPMKTISCLGHTRIEPPGHRVGRYSFLFLGTSHFLV